MSISAPELREAVQARIAWLDDSDVGARLRAGPHDDVDAAPDREAQLASLVRECVADGLHTAVVVSAGRATALGRTLASLSTSRQTSMEVRELESTHPGHVRATLDALPERAFAVAIGGNEVEVGALVDLLWERSPDPSRFAVVTSEGSALDARASDRGFRMILRDPTRGSGAVASLPAGRLLPAALLGAELDQVFRGAAVMRDRCTREGTFREDPGAALGALLAEAATAGRDKLGLPLAESAIGLGIWIEDLVAGATGKRGVGVVPVEGVGLGPPAVYGEDRFFVATGAAGDGPILGWLERAGFPVERLDDAAGPGGELVRWAHAAAVACEILGVDAGDRPEEAEIEQQVRRRLGGASVAGPAPDALEVLFAELEPPAYLSLRAYVAPTKENRHRLNAARLRIRDACRVAVTLGFVPASLHATGQVCAGGPPTGRFAQIVEPLDEDLAVPGEDWSLGQLLRAEADAELAVLQERGRPVARISLGQLEAATAPDRLGA